ncbi:FtsX-like permease family protein [Actinomadura flavalba]|uniref:FtsX-like permease family protein n=1 Tax=Actinomadura flavalba TaxID=1120938 RepID=UPI0003707FA6|nr:FtsX-like permease family protein [Actinomadura flavalba]
MLGLALRSLRRRVSAFTASLLAAFLGATIIMAFGSLLDTSVSGGATGAAAETLTTMAAVVGGWGLVLVVFAVTSTLTLSARQRAGELALLRSVGATPGQIRRMLVGEAAGLAVAGALAAVLPAWLAGRGIVGLLHDADMVPRSIGHTFGAFAAGTGFGITLVAAVVAALLAARRTGRERPADPYADAADAARLPWPRIAAAVLLLGAAVNCAVLTMTVMRDEGTMAMPIAAQAAILGSLSLALLSPALLRGATRLLERPLGAFGVAGELAVVSLRRRTRRLAAVMAPIILFTGVGVGTVHLQRTENAALATATDLPEADARTLETLNYVVIGMIVLFMAIMLVNTLLAATAHRRREFGQQRLAGATPGQVLGTVALEAAVLAAVGVVCGAAVSLLGIVPFAVARIGSPVPEGGPAAVVVVAVLAAALTLGTAYGAARRALASPAVDAVTP